MVLGGASHRSRQQSAATMAAARQYAFVVLGALIVLGVLFATFAIVVVQKKLTRRQKIQLCHGYTWTSPQKPPMPTAYIKQDRSPTNTASNTLRTGFANEVRLLRMLAGYDHFPRVLHVFEDEKKNCPFALRSVRATIAIDGKEKEPPPPPPSHEIVKEHC